jgi:Na+/H+-translocating membrane pyrophosphatase
MVFSRTSPVVVASGAEEVDSAAGSAILFSTFIGAVISGLVFGSTFMDDTDVVDSAAALSTISIEGVCISSIELSIYL